MECPHCGLINPDTAETCDCGHRFFPPPPPLSPGNHPISPSKALRGATMVVGGIVTTFWVTPLAASAVRLALRGLLGARAEDAAAVTFMLCPFIGIGLMVAGALVLRRDRPRSPV